MYEFFNRVLDKLYEALPRPFVLDADGKTRLEYTTAHIALREGLANSIIHAAYTQMGNVTVDRWKNRIVMSNPGTMLVSVEQFFLGQQSVCRNPLIQNMFVQLGIGEKAGSGADIIVNGWKDNGWVSPVVQELAKPDRVMLTLKLEAALSDGQPTSTDINRQERIILETLLGGSKHIEELMKVCGYKNRDSFRKSVLNSMLANGLVKMTHPENVRHREQRYVIANDGQSLISNYRCNT